MKPNGKIIWRCAVCGTPVNNLHEIFFGSSFRKVSVEFNIQAPLDPRCHNTAHGKKDGKNLNPIDNMSQEEIKMYLCSKAEVNYGELLLALNNNDRVYLEGVSVKFKKFLKSLEE